MSDTNTLVMDKPHPTSLLDTGVQGLIGKPLDRIDGPLKVSGTATYAAEYALDGLAYGVLVGARIGAGRIVSVDTDGVRAIPGVIDVVTDFKHFARNPQQGGETDAPTQGVQDIAYFGQLVALVLAESFEAARDAAQRLDIVYESSAGRYDFEALKGETETPPADQIPPASKQGDVEQAMAEAAVAVDVTYTTPSQTSAAMEPHASIAIWEGDALTLYGSYQMLPSCTQQLAKALGVAEKKVRIVSRYVGGGFGSKLGIAPEAVGAALAAKALGRPVKVVMGAATSVRRYGAPLQHRTAHPARRDRRRHADRDRA